LSEPYLAVGTAQFGLPYGLGSTGAPVHGDEARRILEIASAAGVTLLDTAPAYGDIEQRLAGLCAGLPFSVVSKVPSCVDASSASEMRSRVQACVARSFERLGGRLTVMLFHRAEDLLGPLGDEAWRAAADILPAGVRLGVSVYSPWEAAEVRRRHPVSVVQLPGSAFDQRLARMVDPGPLEGVELHLRSVFLQGLMLMDPAVADGRVPGSRDAVARWSAWCVGRGLEPTYAALAVARGLPGVGACIVGLDSAAQARQIVEAWSVAGVVVAPELAVDDLGLVDPRLWDAR
jgi:aryl-alcohol dehydrogenase-like predicted oxidoreductase